MSSPSSRRSDRPHLRGPQAFESIAALQGFVKGPVVTGAPVLVDQGTIDAFGHATGDLQWIHTDPARAALASPFGSTVAHGLLTLGLVVSSYQACFAFGDTSMSLNYGFDKVRFTGAVPAGSRISTSFSLEDVAVLEAANARCFWHVVVHVEEQERPALVADWITQVRFGAAPQTRGRDRAAS